MKGGLRELALFAGAGGGILGGHLLGWRTVCAVEIEDYPRRVLLARQRDGILPRFPIWDDVTTFDGRPWRGRVDVVSGGFPCQDISECGQSRGITGERSGLWSEMARIIREIQPAFAFVENSPMLPRRGLGTVLGDLAAMGMDARWGVFSACSIGAPHARERLFLLVHSNCKRPQTRRPLRDAAGADMAQRRSRQEYIYQVAKSVGRTVWPVRTAQPSIPGVAHGVADRVDRNKAIGNGQVPAVAALAWEVLTYHRREMTSC